MAYGRFQATAQDTAGNVLPEASIEVRLEATGNLVSVYEDRDGMTPRGNPFSAESDGYFWFHAPGGAYRVTATLGSMTKQWRYVAVGLAAESDVIALPTIMLTQAEYDLLDPPDPGTIYYIITEEED